MLTRTKTDTTKAKVADSLSKLNAIDNAAAQTKETVIIIRPGSKKPDTISIGGKTKAPPPPTKAPQVIRDTEIVIKKGRVPPKDTLVVIDNKIVEKGGEKTANILKENRFCSCVAFAIKAPDTIQYEDYLNYTYILKNNCKETVWVHSGSFRFSVANVWGKPVKTIRKLDYVKRFDIPEYVKLMPDEEYEYRFADDAFFQYEIGKGSPYKFSFIYNNTDYKYKAAPGKTYLCFQLKEKMIFVK